MTPILLLLTLAAGSDTPADRPSPPDHLPVTVDAVRWAQPFSLAQATPWTMGSTPRDIDRGWLVELRAPADLLAPRAVGRQVLFVDDVPVRSLHTPLLASCTVVVVPGDTLPSLDKAHWYFGSTNLPERMDAAHGEWELHVALDAGVPVMAPEVIAPPLRVDRFTDLARTAEARFQACRAELDRPRADPNTF